MFYGLQNLRVALFDLTPGHVGIGRDEVDVEFERLGSRFLNLSGKVDSSVVGDPIEAGHNWYIHSRGRAMKHLQIAFRSDSVRR